MTAIDAYGDFEVPEETTKIEVVEDPVKTVLACYDIFDVLRKKLIQKNYQTHGIFWLPQLYEEVFQNGLKLFEGKENLKANENQIEKILNELKNHKSDIFEKTEFDCKGLFLSLLVNQTSINELVIDEFPELNDIGYRLKKNKTIVLGSKIKARGLGEYAEGNTINQGMICQQGCWALDGIHINFGIIGLYQGVLAKNGIFININEILIQGGGEEKGLYINKGQSNKQGWGRGSEGTYINAGTTRYQGDYFPISSTNATFINLKIIEQPSEAIDLTKKTFFEKLIEKILRKKVKKDIFKFSLEQKLAELDFLKTEDQKKLVQLINTYDWNKFNKEVTGLCEKIKEVYGR